MRITPATLRRARWTSKEYGVCFVTANETDERIIKEHGFHTVDVSKIDALITAQGLLPKVGEPTLPVVLFLGFDEDNRKEEFRILHQLSDKCPIMRSNFYDYRRICCGEGVIWKDLSDVPAGEIINCLDADRVISTRIWEAIYCPPERSFPTADKLLGKKGLSDGNQQN